LRSISGHFVSISYYLGIIAELRFVTANSVSVRLWYHCFYAVAVTHINSGTVKRFSSI
jgi:hypothetical protein